MKLTTAQLRKIIAEEVRKARRLQESYDLRTADVVRDVGIVLGAARELSAYMSEGEVVNFDEMVANMEAARDILDELVTKKEQLRRFYA